MSDLTQQRRFTDCFRKCGARLTYDKAHKSPSGKHIPLIIEKDSVGQERLVPHNCLPFQTVSDTADLICRLQRQGKLKEIGVTGEPLKFILPSSSSGSSIISSRRCM